MAAKAEDLSRRDLLSRTAVFTYCTTRATNAILEGKTAKTAFLTTEGYRDILLYREGGKEQPHNAALPFPKPYIPRRLTFEISERILADGSVAMPLDERQLEATLERLRELAVEAVGVCLLWSPANPQHELRVGEMIEAILPDVDYTLSHRINPIIREYRRASSAVIDASLKPLMRRHLHELSRRLRDSGFGGAPLMVTHVSGGVRSLEEMALEPLHTVDCGPALAPVAALRYSEEMRSGEARDLLVVDTGGTSFDVSLTRAGKIVYTREKWLGPKWVGHLTGLPAVDTQSLGSGGGSIARVDEGGLLKVGPESAGADPGPACYGRGGQQPTVTDAAVILGYINPNFFLGGRMQLDMELAREAIREEVAAPLQLSVEEAAQSILVVSSEAMRGFIMDMTVAQGVDPRRCLMVAGGGAAGLNVAWIARELGIGEVLIPRLAAGLSATGGEYADLMATFSQGHYASTRTFDHDGVNDTLDAISAQMDRFFAGLVSTGRTMRNFFCEARYVGEIWEIEVDLGSKNSFSDDSDDHKLLEEAYDRTHKEIFSVNEPGREVEIITWRGEARIVGHKPELYSEADGAVSKSGSSLRKVFIDQRWEDGHVYVGGSLPTGAVIEGPAIIEEPTTSIVVLPNSQVTVHATHYLLTIED